MQDHPLATDSPDCKESKGSSIQVIDRMMNLIDALASHSEPITLKQLAQDTQLHPSTAHRILGALIAQGFVERTDSSCYRLGIRLLELGNLVKSRISVREVAMPAMLRLHAFTGESVNLGMRSGDEIVYVERTSSGRSAVRVVHIVGARAPLHTTATGKLFLAEDNANEVRAYVERTGLPSATTSSITSLAALEQELAKVRSAHLAYDMEEVENGVRCIAAAIRDDQGKLVAGLSLSTPVERFNSDWASIVKATAAEISRSLGYVA
ncbi:IclR family transcriptional regulator [Uliginosibacterium gangwonense]|uniref:IclR family transcriptional regulator n=1 Tax=Uliginosibacterium gangwonense TaxID=392736 RepID=UPI00036F8C21|nr:IclR family transcriptional regulator [Uliginosibacterium gangwonense]